MENDMELKMYDCQDHNVECIDIDGNVFRGYCDYFSQRADEEDGLARIAFDIPGINMVSEDRIKSLKILD